MKAGAKESRNFAWMVVYGDMVTLLLTFFVLLFVIMKEAENNVYKMIDRILTVTESQIKTHVMESNLTNDIIIDRGTKGIHLTISSGALFSVGDDEVKPELKPLLDKIGEAVAQVRYIPEEEDPRFSKFFKAINKRGLKFEIEIRVEGHTDNTPISTPKFPSNWELSSFRAMNVMKYMSKTSGIGEKSFSALGYGEYRPLFPNDTFKKRAANRRVEIFIDADVVKKTL